jgi:hypothetical protein
MKQWYNINNVLDEIYIEIATAVGAGITVTYAAHQQWYIGKELSKFSIIKAFTARHECMLSSALLNTEASDGGPILSRNI